MNEIILFYVKLPSIRSVLPTLLPEKTYFSQYVRVDGENCTALPTNDSRHLLAAICRRRQARRSFRFLLPHLQSYTAKYTFKSPKATIFRLDVVTETFKLFPGYSEP